MGPRSRAKLFLMAPFVYQVLVVRDILAMKLIARGLLARARLVRRWIVRQNQDMLVFLMFEEVVDPFLLHKPRHEVEIRFPVLRAIVALDEVAVKPKLEILKTQVRENLLNDVRSFHILKDPAIGRARQEPEPGHHLGAVGGELAVQLALGEPADENKSE